MSMMFKAKKYMASKFSESKTGQSLILRLFGKQGVAIMDALIASASRFFGPQQAKQLKVDILKLITKIVLLYRNAVITAEKAAPARPTMLSMMDSIIDTLEASPPQRNVQALALAIQATHDGVMPLLQPNVREHNWQRLTRVFDAYGSNSFLTQFLFEAPYEQEREAVLLNFKALVTPFETEMTEMKKFQRAQQEQRRVRMEKMVQPQGSKSGGEKGQPPSTYSLRAWLDDVHGSVLFQDWLRESSGEPSVHLLLFLRSVDYYRGTNNRGLLNQRAGQVVDAFLSPRATQPVKLTADSLKTDVLAAFESGKPSRGIFDACEADATSQLEALFLTGFAPNSAQFKSLEVEIESLSLRLTRIDKLTTIHTASGAAAAGGAGAGGGGASASLPPSAETANVLEMDLKDLGVGDDDDGGENEEGGAATSPETSASPLSGVDAGAAAAAGGGGGGAAAAAAGAAAVVVEGEARDSADDTKDLEGM